MLSRGPHPAGPLSKDGPARMAQRTPPPSSARSRGRKPAPVKKPFPVGFAAGCAVLAMLLVGVIVYAVQHQGVGDTSSLAYADTQVGGVVKTTGLKRNHKTGVLTYPNSATTPPDGGDHNALPQSCMVYRAQIPNEHAVHSLEHGAVWVTYNPTTAKPADVAALTKLVSGDSYRMLSPYPGLKSPISLQAWGRQLFVSSAGDSRVKQFLSLFTSGPQAPERSALCTGNTSTGTTPTATAPDGSVVPPTMAPNPKATAQLPVPTPTK